MRIVAFITETSVIDQILAHLRTRAAHAGARSGRYQRLLRSPKETAG